MLLLQWPVTGLTVPITHPTGVSASAAPSSSWLLLLDGSDLMKTVRPVNGTVRKKKAACRLKTITSEIKT